MLNCGVVDKMLWMGVLRLVAWCVVILEVTMLNGQRKVLDHHNILSTAPQLSISQKALGTLPEDG
jgi:hypothetical protein